MTLDKTGFELAAALREKVRTHKPCRGYGHVLRDGKLETCECKADADFQLRMSRSAIPPKFRRKGFKDYVYKDGQAYKAIQDYLAKAEEHRRDGVGLYLYGPSYTGKSLLACSLITELMRKGWDCKYLSFDGVLDAMRDEEERQDADIDRRWDFLVLDHVGDVLRRLNNFREVVLTGEKTHGAVDYLAAIVSKRTNAGMPMIIPSSVSLADVNAKFPSLANALIGSCLYVECEDKGFRQKQLDLMMDPEG